MLTFEVDPLVRAIDDIAAKGYSVIDDFLTPPVIQSLSHIVSRKWKLGQMKSAKTGKAGLRHEEIRGDYIAWLEADDANPAVNAYFRQMEMLRLHLNMQLMMNVQALETHTAFYPVGSAYQKHLDQFSHGATPSLQARQLSAVLYLNQDWQMDDGGALRLYIDEEKYLDVFPQAGRIVLFLSAKFWHEVLPVKRERLSLTGWFRTREQSLI